MKKRTTTRLILLAIVMGFFWFTRDPEFIETDPDRFREIDTAPFSVTCCANIVEWMDDFALLTGSAEQLSLWDIQAGKNVHTFKSAIPVKYDQSAALSAAPSRNVAVFDYETLEVWKLEEETPFFVWSIPGKERCLYDSFNVYSFSPDGTWLVLDCSVYTEQPRTYLWNVNTQQTYTYITESLNYFDPFAANVLITIRNATISARHPLEQTVHWQTQLDYPDLNALSLHIFTETSVLICDYKTCFLLDRQTGVLQQRFEFKHSLDYAFIFDDSLVTLHQFGFNRVRIEINNVKTGVHTRRTFKVPSPIGYYSMEADLNIHGELAISFHEWNDLDSGGYLNLQWTPVYVYDVATLDLLTILDTHTDAVPYIKFDPSGTYLFTGSLDHTFKIWEIQR